MFWPIFSCYLGVTPEDRFRLVINTLLALTGGTTATFITSLFMNHGKLNMEDVLNATVAGGVIVGSSADIIIDPLGNGRIASSKWVCTSDD